MATKQGRNYQHLEWNVENATNKITSVMPGDQNTPKQFGNLGNGNGDAEHNPSNQS